MTIAPRSWTSRCARGRCSTRCRCGCRSAGPRGAYAVGDPEAVAEKILFWHGMFGQDRTLIQVAIGDVPHREVLRAIELLGTKVAPLVQAGL